MVISVRARPCACSLSLVGTVNMSCTESLLHSLGGVSQCLAPVALLAVILALQKAGMHLCCLLHLQQDMSTSERLPGWPVAVPLPACPSRSMPPELLGPLRDCALACSREQGRKCASLIRAVVCTALVKAGDATCCTNAACTLRAATSRASSGQSFEANMRGFNASYVAGSLRFPDPEGDLRLFAVTVTWAVGDTSCCWHGFACFGCADCCLACCSAGGAPWEAFACS